MPSPEMGYKPGNEIFRCEPFAYVVSQKSSNEFCDWCLKRAESDKTLQRYVVFRILPVYNFPMFQSKMLADWTHELKAFTGELSNDSDTLNLV